MSATMEAERLDALRAEAAIEPDAPATGAVK
jgi:hypothetical protein